MSGKNTTEAGTQLDSVPGRWCWWLHFTGMGSSRKQLMVALYSTLIRKCQNNDAGIVSGFVIISARRTTDTSTQTL